MKVTVVPAQVTTVEDRIMGSLGFSQLLLLVVPIFVGGGLFALLPPLMNGAIYKYLIMGVVAIVCGTLAIRIKGKIVAAWLVTILRYALRPKYYLYNKNVTTLRQDYPAVVAPPEEETQPASTRATRPALHRLSLPEATKLLATLENPAAHVRFETTRKGGLNVRFTEVEE